MNYLIKFDENGRRNDTYVKEEKTEEEIVSLLEQGFLEISETEYQLLLGNVDGQEYLRNEDGTFKPYIPPEPTQEEINSEIQARLTKAVQDLLDNEAQKLNYDSCLSVCSYVNTGIAKFDNEGQAFREWRSAVWAKGYEILDDCLSGTRAVPNEEELLSELPKLTISYSE